MNFGGGAETDNNSAETDKSGYTSKYQYLGPPLVAVPKNTIAVPKQKKLVPKRTKFKVPKKVPKRVATPLYHDLHHVYFLKTRCNCTCDWKSFVRHYVEE
jgi:hypothetical protein